MTRVESVLCVSNTDTCRGPILKVMLKMVLGSLRCSVESAGTYMGIGLGLCNNPAHPCVIKVMLERHMNIRHHRSRLISMVEVNEFDLIVCATQEEVDFVAAQKPRGKILLANANNGGVPSPLPEQLETYRECADILFSVAEEVVETFF